MKIVAFDIDGTLTDEVGFMREYAPKFLKKVYGFDVIEVNKNAYELSEMYDLKSILLDKGYERETAEEKAKQISQEFWNKYFVKYCAEPIRDGAKEIIDTFRKKGYAIHIVSMRGKKTKEYEKAKDRLVRKWIVPLLTKRQLWKAGIKVDCLEMPVSIEKKIEYVRAINPEYYFEDQSELIRLAAEAVGVKSKVICVNNSYNFWDEFSEKTRRINGFKDEWLSQELEKIADSDCGNRQDRQSGQNLFYKVAKFLGSPIVYAIYKPIIFGKSNIPKEKSIAFVGNHRTKSDPIIMIAVAKQIIHWAALQRMFTGGEDLFSSSKSRFRCNFSAMFLRWMGAVPIARPEDADYQNINLRTIKYLTSQLKKKKGSIGFFPEGTLNREPEKQNILPLKSDGVFKIASMTKCLLQPFSIVWIPKNNVIRNRVIVCFSYPINCEGRSADELSAIWWSAVDKNIEEANEIIRDLLSEENRDRREMQRKIKDKIKDMENS